MTTTKKKDKADPLEALLIDSGELLSERISQAAEVAAAASTDAPEGFREIAKQVIFAEVFSGDRELLVMRMIHEKLNPLGPEARRRVVRWLADRYEDEFQRIAD